MVRPVRWSIPPAIIAGTCLLAYLWARSWADHGFETMDCAGGSYFLADLGWGIQGVVLGAAAAITIAIVTTTAWSYPAAIAALVVAGLVAGWAADLGGAAAAAQVGCDPFYTREAGGAITLGMGLAGIPTMLILGVVVLVRVARNPRHPVAVPDAIAAGFRRRDDPRQK